MTIDGATPDDPAPLDAAAIDEPADFQPLDPLTEATLRELEQPQRDRTWLQSAFLLVISLLAFAATGFFNHEPSRLVLLIGVLLFHELGHYAGMRLFNYQDVRMFFIPLFGAAVAGRSRSVEGYKEAIVLLLGPLPGIVLGGVLGAAALVYDNELLHSAAVLLVVLNGFNLLPFMPLDGGRLLHLVLFSRQHYLEALFRVVTGGLLAWWGILTRSWLLALAGGSIVLQTGTMFRISKLAKKLRGPLQTGGKMDLAAAIPREYAVPLIERVQQMFPQMKQPKQLATTVRQVWERIHIRPPGLAASLGLLALYAGGLLAAPVIAVLMFRPVERTVAHANPDGSVTRVHEVRAGGRLVRSTELDADNRPHGKYVLYHRRTGRVAQEGAYKNGHADGAWKSYSPEGRLLSVEHFRDGKPVNAEHANQPPPAEEP